MFVCVFRVVLCVFDVLRCYCSVIVIVIVIGSVLACSSLCRSFMVVGLCSFSVLLLCSFGSCSWYVLSVFVMCYLFFVLCYLLCVLCSLFFVIC